MSVVLHEIAGTRIAEVARGSVRLETTQAALELFMGLAYDPGVSNVILHQDCLAPAFFDLKTGLAGDILQKVSNYRIRLAIVGNFAELRSDSLRAFIAESNRGRQIFFAESLAQALEAMAARAP